MHRIVCTVGLIALCAASLPAQDDVDFAEALMRRGWDDLAEMVAIETERTGSSQELRARAGFLYYRILNSRAQASGLEADFAKAEEWLEDIQRKYSNTTIGQFSELDVLLNQVTKAETYMGNAKEADNPDEAADFLTRARGLFEEVLTRFDELTERLAADLEEYREREILTDPDLRERANKRDLAEFLEIKALKSYTDVLEGLDDEERRKQLGSAIEKAEFYYLERYSPINVSRWCWATIIYGQVNLNMALISEGNDRSHYFDQAIDYFEEMSLFRVRQLPPEPEAREAIESFVKEVSLESFFHLVNAQNRAAREFKDSKYLDDALIFTDKALGGPNAGPKGARWEGETESFWARRLLLEKSVTLTLAGRTLEGLEILVEEVERSKRSRDAKAEWLGLDRFGVAACQKMSEIWESSEITLPSSCAVLAGQGFLFRGDEATAAKAFASGVTGARSESDKDEAADGLWQAGMCYVRMERKLEAALVFESIYKHFPNAPVAGKAATYAADYLLQSQAAMKVGSSVLEPMVSKASEVASSAGGGETGWAVVFKTAQNHEKKGQFSKAAAEYAKIPETDYNPDTQKEIAVELYGLAQANGGNCHFKEYERTGRERDWETARDMIANAIRWADETGDIKVIAQATFLLARVYNDEKRDEAEKVVEIVSQTFDNIGEQWLMRAGSRQLQVVALCRLERPNEAAELLAEIERCVEKDDQARGAYKNAISTLMQHFGVYAREYNVLTQAAASEVGRLRKNQKVLSDDPGAVASIDLAIDSLRLIQEQTYAEHLSAAKKSAKYAATWAELSEDLDLDVKNWLATVLFTGQSYESAISIYEEILAAEAEMSPALLQELPAAKLNLAVCYSETGQLKKAADLLDALNEEQKDEYGVLAERARVKLQLYEQQRADGIADPNLLLEGVKPAYDEFFTLLKQIGEENYDAVVEGFPSEVKDYTVKYYQTVYNLYLINFYNDEWRTVVSDIQFHERFNEFDVLPRNLVDKFMRLKEDSIREGKL